MNDIKIKRAARTVVFDDDDKVAILSVRGGEYYKIPGGAIEGGETEQEAAKREAIEEAGVEVDLLDELGEDEFIDPIDKNKIHHSVCYLAKKKGDLMNPSFEEWERENNFELFWTAIDEAIVLFEGVKTDDPFASSINERDLKFIKKAKEILNK